MILDKMNYENQLIASYRCRYGPGTGHHRVTGVRDHHPNPVLRPGAAKRPRRFILLSPWLR